MRTTFFCVLFLILSTCTNVTSLKINCGSIYDNYKNWDFDQLHYYFSDTNLQKTLYCIGYDRTVSPAQVTEYHDHQDIKQFLSIEENDSVIAFQMHSSNSYFDKRLNFSYDIHYQLDGQRFWNPSIQNANILSAKSLSAGENTVSYQIKKDGKLELLWNVILTKQCHLDFQWYPFDSQRCTHYPTSSDAKLFHDSRGTKRFENSEWIIHIDYNANGTEFVLHRKISGMILHLYFPSIFITVASMMSLYLPFDLYPARMSLAVTTCLSMVTFFKGSQGTWPKTSYIKAIGVWAAFCYATVFFCLIEYCFVLALSKEHHISRNLPKVIEKLCRILIPMIVLTFVTSYFGICLFH